MNKKQIGINIIMNFLSFLLGLLLTFFLTPYIIKVLGIEAYGFFPMANTIISYTGVLTIAVNSMASRFISIAYHRGEIEKAEKYFNTVFVADIVLAIILFVISAITVTFLEKIINIPAHLVYDVKILFLLLFFGTLFVLALSAFKTATFVKNRIDIDAYVKIIKVLVRAAFLFALFSLFTPNILFVGLASCLIFVIEALLYVRIKNKLLPNLSVNLKLYNKKYLKRLIEPGMWGSVGQINSILLLGLDLVIANLLLGVQSQGVLAIAKTIPAYSFLLANIVATSFVPTLTKAFAQNEESLFDNLKKSFVALSLFGSIILGGVLSVGDIFYKLWVPNLDYNELQILTVLSLAPTTVLYGVMTINAVFVIKNDVKINALVNLGVAFASCALAIVLVKTTSLDLYAIAGVSSVLLIVMYLVFTLPYIAKKLGRKWYEIFPYMFKAWGCVAIVFLVGLGIRNLLVIDSWLMLGFGALLIALLSFTINFFVATSRGNRKVILDKVKEYVSRFKS